ncbi:MAG: KAP family P-loop NTPase fold protein [Rhodospirillales bacterium]
MAADVHAYGKRVLGGNARPSRSFLAKSKKIGVALLPSTTRIAAKVGTFGILSLEEIEAAGEGLSGAVQAIANESTNSVEKVISERIRKRKEELASVLGFKSSLESLAEALAKNLSSKDANSEGVEKPLIIVVDELDRCRPTYALKVIESIKHLFSVNRVCFLLSGDLTQLQAIIEGAYGNSGSFDSTRYLEKFFQLKISLPLPPPHTPGQINRYSNYVLNTLGLDRDAVGNPRALKDVFAIYANCCDMSLRTIERTASQVALYVASGGNTVGLETFVVGLCILRNLDERLFRKAISNSLSYTDINSVLKINDIPKPNVRDFQEQLWHYAIGSGLSDHVIDRLDQQFFHSHLDRGEFLPHIAAKISWSSMS